MDETDIHELMTRAEAGDENARVALLQLSEAVLEEILADGARLYGREGE